MKHIFRTLIVFAFFGIMSCEQGIEEINVDPNNSPSASDGQILAAALGNMGYMVDVDLNSASFLWAQYYTWGIGVSLGNQERYVAEPDDFDAYWGTAYSDILIDLKFLTKSESSAYSGVGKALTAYVFQGLVDHFGDIPFTEALSGEIADGGILLPKYEQSNAVYTSLIAIVDDAINDLSTASSSDIGADDFVYGGDVQKWMKFANSLKLRILMRTSEIAPNGDAIKSLIANGTFIESDADVAEVPFSGAAGGFNPMYARFEWGVGDFYFASNATLDLLDDLNDPRGTAFYSPASTGTFKGNLRGIIQGSVDRDVPFTDPSSDYSGSSSKAYDKANSVILMSDWEVWFLRAEADARYGTADTDSDAFATAIANNFAYLGVSGAADYVATLNYGGNLDAKIDKIATQKWIAMNGTQEDEGWIETRRFDRPASRLFTAGIFQNPPYSVLGPGKFPSIWLVPASERSLNPNAPAQRVITDKVFWDN